MVESLQKKNKELQKRMFGISVIEGNDRDTKFFTGLPNGNTFSCSSHHLLLFMLLPSMMSCSWCKAQLILTGDLAHRFGISVGLASKIFQKWLDVMFVQLSFLITSREVLKQNMPQVFKQLYPNCGVIIYC